MRFVLQQLHNEQHVPRARLSIGCCVYLAAALCTKIKPRFQTPPPPLPVDKNKTYPAVFVATKVDNVLSALEEGKVFKVVVNRWHSAASSSGPASADEGVI